MLDQQQNERLNDIHGETRDIREDVREVRREMGEFRREMNARFEAQDKKIDNLRNIIIIVAFGIIGSLIASIGSLIAALLT